MIVDSMICGMCGGIAKYEISFALRDGSSEPDAFCGECSQVIWRKNRPLSNPNVLAWHQELIRPHLV